MLSSEDNQMPVKPSSPCRSPRCPNLSVSQGYCDQHQALAKQARRLQDKDRNLGTRKERGYGVEWQRLRLTVLNQEPLCCECAKIGRIEPAVEVDHIDGDVRNTDLENLQPLCHSCHSRKTATENGAFGNKKRINSEPEMV